MPFSMSYSLGKKGKNSWSDMDFCILKIGQILSHFFQVILSSINLFIYEECNIMGGPPSIKGPCSLIKGMVFFKGLLILYLFRANLDRSHTNNVGGGGGDNSSTKSLMLSKCQFQVLLSDLQRAHKTMSDFDFLNSDGGDEGDNN